jgi:hypothetical protein
MAEINTANLQGIAAPNLPIAPTEYSHTYFDVLTNVFRLYFNRLTGFNNGLISTIILLNTPSAGTTAERPTTDLQIGQQYFDTTIGRPIWWNGSNWINAAGTVV